MGSAKLNADETALIENLEAMMAELRDKKLSGEEQDLMDSLASTIAELQRMDAGGDEEQEDGEDRLSPEEELITRNLLDDIGKLPGGPALIREAAGGTVAKELEFRSGTRYGAERYDNPRRSEPEPGTADVAAQIRSLREALDGQAAIVRELLKGLGIADSVAGFGHAGQVLPHDEQDRPSGFNDPQQERLWALHKVEREADDLAGRADEELRRRPSRHEYGEVQKAMDVKTVADEVAGVVARLGGASSRAGASGAEVTRDIAKDLLTATFTAEAASPDRRW